MNMFSIQVVQFVVVAYLICRFGSKAKWRHGLMTVGAAMFICMQNAPHIALNFLFVLMTLAVFIIGWHMGRSIAQAPEEQKSRQLKFGILFLVAPLLFFKLIQIVVPPHLVSNILAIRGNIEMTALAPLGISYFSFRSMSYLIEIRKKNIEPVKFWQYVNYVAFWPTFMAGPIERPAAFFRQMKLVQRIGNENLRIGVTRILTGLVKKMIIGDFFYQIANPYLLMSGKPIGALGEWTTWQLWICLHAYYFYLYCDFSGYSDVAIGIARIFGYRILENFRWPILATNIADFWRRWHISLTGWITDYVYIGLGGNRRGPQIAARNTMAAMILVGVWHGLSPHFAIWGIYHAIFLNIYRRMRKKHKDSETPATWWRTGIAWFLTFQIVNIGWVPFIFGARKTLIIWLKLFGLSGGLP